MKQFLCLGEGYAFSKLKLKRIYIRYFSLLAVVFFMCAEARAQPERSEVPTPVRSPAQRSTAPTGKDTLDISKDTLQIEEVEISTGYQRIPKGRVTGSFVFIDSTLFNRTFSTDVLSRLDGLVSGLRFNRNPGAPFDLDLNIRGQATLNLDDQPLIILDNFEYNGDLRNINPNDVLNITVLKDASASSIWGAKAGNGVIVINTKAGNYSAPTKISYNSNIGIRPRPDLYRLPQLASSDYIDLEIDLYNRGYYSSTLRNVNKPAITPIVWLLHQREQGFISPSDSARMIDAYRQLDSRADQEAYFLRTSVSQQHALSLSGGGMQNRYYASIGWDRNLNASVGSAYNRLSININHTFGFFDNRLEIQSGLIYTRADEEMNDMNPIPGAKYPYASFADAEGNALPIARYNQGFLDTVGNGALLDWTFRPLDELEYADNRQHTVDMKLNMAVRYRATEWLKLQALYQYGDGNRARRNHYGLNTFLARDLINEFSEIAANGEVVRAVPLGGILDRHANHYLAHQIRGQANIDRHWADHELQGMIGAELNSRNTHTSSYRYYGYYEDRPESIDVDPINSFTSMITGRKNIRIPTNQGLGHLTDRFVSFYANGGYHYRRKYHLTASMRKDGSNLFGVHTNQKWNPLWSVGFKWSVDKESFFRFPWLSELSLRATYGTSGNIDNTVSALLVARSFPANSYGRPALTINTPPNPNLRWETVSTANVALDFAMFRGRRISGSIEYYLKSGRDLMGSSALPPSSGLLTYYGNTASMRGHGIDISLQSRNLGGLVDWRSSVLYSFATNKVTEYHVEPANISGYFSGSFIVGKPVQAMYAYPWAGLNPENGNPVGYLNGDRSEDYAAITNSTDLSNLTYVGSSLSPHFGSLRNSFSWKGFDLSFLISFKMGHFFRKGLLNYQTLYSGVATGGAAYFPFRWQKPGDEQRTHVPSMVYPAVTARDNFYTRSEIGIEKAGFVRLQDVRLGYLLKSKAGVKWPFREVQLFAMANNVALLWKAANDEYDSDFGYLYSQVSYSAGLKMNL